MKYLYRWFPLSLFSNEAADGWMTQLQQVRRQMGQVNGALPKLNGKPMTALYNTPRGSFAMCLISCLHFPSEAGGLPYSIDVDHPRITMICLIVSLGLQKSKLVSRK